MDRHKYHFKNTADQETLRPFCFHLIANVSFLLRRNRPEPARRSSTRRRRRRQKRGRRVAAEQLSEDRWSRSERPTDNR